MVRILPLLVAPLLLAAYGTTPLRIEQGATWTKSLRTNTDLSGCTLDMEIRTAAGGTLLGAPHYAWEDQAHGQFRVYFSAAESGALSWTGNAAWDVEATCASGTQRLFQGTAALDPQVTTGEVAPGEFPIPATGLGEFYLRRSFTWDRDSAPLLYAWTPNDTHGVPHSAFELQLGGSDFFTERDHTAGQGWNCTRLAGEPKLCDQWEDHYRTGPGGTKLWMERFWEAETRPTPSASGRCSSSLTWATTAPR
jgi:hypothetical protein